MLNASEVADLLLNHFGGIASDISWHGVQEGLTMGVWSSARGEYDPPNNVVPGLGTVTLEEHFGGEGQGDHAHLVFRVHCLTDTEEWLKYYQVDGYYSSYEGTDWDGDLYQVTPRQKTITVFEKVEG